VVYKPRSQALDPFNGSDRNVFAARTNAPVNGLQRSQLLALAAVVVCRLVLLSHHGLNPPLGRAPSPSSGQRDL
jgi:hypothetical protein